MTPSFVLYPLVSTPLQLASSLLALATCCALVLGDGAALVLVMLFRTPIEEDGRFRFAAQMAVATHRDGPSVC